MIEIANLLVSSLAVMASCTQAYVAWEQRKSKLNSAQKRLNEPLKKGGSQIAKVIDEDLLEALSEKASNAARKHVEHMRTATQSEAKQIADDARKELCFYLSEIRKYNKNELPTARLKGYWESYQCGQDYCEADVKQGLDDE
ncbi:MULTISPECIES: hypothetical protein [Shewanella]|uniref:hypothetical protein n=1 Tax=Shewanella TaxID=22 RepID=UPI001182F24E|nr:hypothetical protein [Shewanella algae]TVL59847.1 hypothetical protein AYJ00_13185 [Shewanella algae]